MWQPEHQALLERLEDEEVLARLWEHEAPGAPHLHPRAAGLIRMLREQVGGPERIEAMVSGDPAPLVAALRPVTMAGLPGPLLHHLAIYNARLAAATADAERRQRAELHSLGAWVALAEQRTYLEALGHTLLERAPSATGSADSQVAAAVDEVAHAPLNALFERARSGARELRPETQVALRALGRVSDACRLSGCSARGARRFERHAERLRARAIEAALLPIREAVNDATARGAAEREGEELMQRVAAVWRWADNDEHVERFAIDVVTPIAWNVYHEPNSDAALRRLLSPLDDLVDHLAWRIEADGSRIAYAAPCAQMYVFRSEMATTTEERHRFAERSLEICPSHRNGRLILASLLVHGVRDRLDGNGMFLQRSDFHEMQRSLERAKDLYPRTKGLDELEQRLADAREQSWWA